MITKKTFYVVTSRSRNRLKAKNYIDAIGEADQYRGLRKTKLLRIERTVTETLWVNPDKG